MRKLKCILGHNKKLMKLDEVITEQYKNDNEIIKTYKCKYCDEIIGGKSISVTPKVIFDKEIVKKENKNNHDFKIHKYQNWSEENIRHYIYTDGKDGVIYLVSNEDISEMEFMGIVFLTKLKFAIYNGLDINYQVYRSKYNENIDVIRPKHNSPNRLTTYDIAKSYKGSEPIINNTNIIAIEYHCVKRYNKSWLWRLFNPRVCNGEYDYD